MTSLATRPNPTVTLGGEANSDMSSMLSLFQDDIAQSDAQLIKAGTIVHEVTCPHLKFEYVLNPYEGLEHDVIAHDSGYMHQYWGCNAALDEKTTIIAKTNAAELLADHLQKPSWQGKPIMISGHVDCYHPLEHQLKLTRAVLEVCLEHRQPIALMTKNDLILRDIDLLSEMASMNLIQVAISITTINEALRREMEPHTSTAYARFETVKKLAKRGIPVAVMMAPVIPGLNDHEMSQIATNAAKMGARAFHYTLMTFNGHLEEVFIDWLEAKFPKRKERVATLIKSCRKRAVPSDNQYEQFGAVKSYADSIREQHRSCHLKNFSHKPKMPQLTSELFMKKKFRQLSLFDTWTSETA